MGIGWRRKTLNLVVLLASLLVVLLLSNAPAGAAAVTDGQSVTATMAVADAQLDRMVRQLAQLDPQLARADPRQTQVAFIKPVVRFISKIARGVKKLAGVIQKAVKKMIALGRTIQEAVSELAHGLTSTVARAIFKPLPPTIRNVLVVAAGAYGEALLTGKFWGTKVGRNITKWVGKLDRINIRLDKLQERMDKLQECLKNPLTCRWTQEKIDKELSQLRRDKIRQMEEKIKTMERIRQVRHGIRPPPPPRRVPASPPRAPTRTTEGTGRGRGCCGG